MIFGMILFCNFSSSFGNAYSREINTLMRKTKPSFQEVEKFIDNPPASFGEDHERALAVNLLYKIQNEKVVSKLKLLATDTSYMVRIATIIPLLKHKQESLGCKIYKNEILNNSRFRFDTPNPFYAPNAVGTEYKLQILKKNPRFIKELSRTLSLKHLDDMLRLRVAVTIYYNGYKDKAKETAKSILNKPNISVPVKGWAEWILRDFKNKKDH
jgi:hypothetical protein